MLSVYSVIHRLYFSIPPSPSSTLFPYTTLFRSNRAYEPLLFDVATIPFPAAGKEQATLDAFEEQCRTKPAALIVEDRKSTRLNSSHLVISYAVFCLKKKNKHNTPK